MQAHNRNVRDADVVAVFENQDDADEAILQLRLAGFRDSQIGYFAWNPFTGWTNLLEHDRSFAGSVIGGIVGAALGVGLAWVLNIWSDEARNLRDFFGLAITCATFGALFVGLIGWGIGAGVSSRGVAIPAIDPNAGAFVMAVVAGDACSTAWSAIHRNGGHEPPAGAMMAHPAAV